MKKIITSIIFVTLLTSCYVGWTYNGTYHYDAYVVIPKKVIIGFVIGKIIVV